MLKNHQSRGFIRQTFLHQQMLVGLTTQFATSCKKFEEIIDLVRDRDPQNSLDSFLDSPAPFYDSPLIQKAVFPIEKWRQLGAAYPLWPGIIRKKASLLTPGSATFPSWTKIRLFFKSVGFEAVPVQGYVGDPIYAHLITTGRIPFCTQLVLRYQKSPYYVVPPDAFHDLGHGLALCMKDYKELLIKFSSRALKTKSRLSVKRLNYFYGKYFEHAMSFQPNGDIEPIGPAPLVLETLFVRNGKLKTKLREFEYANKLTSSLKPFASRIDWVEQTENFIKKSLL